MFARAVQEENQDAFLRRIVNPTIITIEGEGKGKGPDGAGANNTCNQRKEGRAAGNQQETTEGIGRGDPPANLFRTPHRGIIRRAI